MMLGGIGRSQYFYSRNRTRYRDGEGRVMKHHYLWSILMTGRDDG